MLTILTCLAVAALLVVALIYWYQARKEYVRLDDSDWSERGG